MNGFDVQASPEAEDQLTAIWTSAEDLRDAITAAQDSAERKLANDPQRFGRHLAEGLFRLDSPPLVIFYTIDSAERTVSITEIHFRP